jgi:hypothetical protein
MAVLLGTLDTTGGTDSFFPAGECGATEAIAAASGNVATLSITIRVSGFTSLILAIYADSGADSPGALLGTTSSDPITDTTAGTKTADLDSPVAVTNGTKYWLACLPLGNWVDFTRVVGGQYFYKSGQSSMPSPYGTPTGDTSSGFPMIGESASAQTVTLTPATETDAAVAITVTQAGQHLAPSADSVDGSWTDQAGGTALAAAIDETSASDSDFIRSEFAPASSACRVKLAAGTDPASSSGHTIHWRTGKTPANGSTINMTVDLYQGGGNVLGAGTLIASFDRNNVGALTTYDEVLSGGEADSITDYTDLYLEFTANQA